MISEHEQCSDQAFLNITKPGRRLIHPRINASFIANRVLGGHVRRPERRPPAFSQNARMLRWLRFMKVKGERMIGQIYILL